MSGQVVSSEIKTTESYLKISMKMTGAELDLIDLYFRENPRMKRGETFRAWIMQGVRDWESTQEPDNRGGES